MYAPTVLQSRNKELAILEVAANLTPNSDWLIDRNRAIGLVPKFMNQLQLQVLLGAD
jgi:hypothetical protein